jgi:DNA-binding GntR family transcriptional regulator
MLALTSKEAMEILYADHQQLLEAIMSGNASIAEETLRAHLGRLSPTIDAIYTTHRSYFDD